jgi:hypothetical protein
MITAHQPTPTDTNRLMTTIAPNRSSFRRRVLARPFGRHFAMRMHLIAFFAIAVTIAFPLRAQINGSREVPVKDAATNDAVQQLSPFIVDSRDSGWVASTTLSGQRTQEQLSNLPITVFGMTAQFMQDLNVFTLEDASRWVTGVDVTNYQDRRTDDQLTTYRGMTTGDRATTQTSRNFFSWFSPTDQYNIDRVDFNFGSNSLMYGDATPGGLATTYTKVPQFHNFGTALASFDNFESHRFQLDINRKLTDKWAFRVNAVDRNTRSFGDFSENKLRAITGAVLYKPFANTTIRAEAESGLFRRVRSTGENAIASVAAPGKGYNSTGWYYTSDGTIIDNSATGTVAAIDKTGPGGTNYSFLEGQNVAVSVQGAIRNYQGLSKEINLLGTGDYINRPYKNGSIWIDQSIGKLSLEASYNQQREVQQRNDTDFGGTGSGADAGAVINVDGNGRPYVDMVTPNPKVYSIQAKNYRFTAAYPFEFGNWMKQFVVVSGSNEVENIDTTRYNMANFAVENGATVPITSNKIIYRAYLDTPSIASGDFWNRFSFLTRNLPSTPTFQPGYYYSSDPNAPWVDVRYLKTWAVSTSGRYFQGKFHTLFGVRNDESNRKRIVNQPNDAIGQAIFLGSPNAAPQAYSYDPEYQISHRTYQAGALYNLFTTESNSLNVYADYSTSYHFQGFEKWNGQTLGPVLGQTREFGFKGDTFGRNLSYTLSFYRQTKENGAFAWSNPSGFTTTGVGAANSMQTLFNPIGLSPSDPSYFTVATGNNSEDHTTSANEKAKGVEVTLQLRRIHGFQVLLNGSYNKLSASRDFTDFTLRLNAALARQTAYLAAGLAGYSTTLIAAAQQLVANNVGTVDVQGVRSKPYAANLLVDYEFSNHALKGTRVAIGGNWSSKYNILVANTGLIKGDSLLPISAYVIHQRKVLNYLTDFRLGATNLCDLEHFGKKWHTVGITTAPVGGVSPAIYQEAYLNPLTITFTTTLHF